MFGFFYNLGNTPSVSEDLVQNVFIRMLKYKHTFTGQGSFTAWMFTMARNVHYDHYKKVRQKGIVGELSGMDYKLAEDVTAEDAISKAEDKMKLKKALGQLSNDKREVLVLSKLNGLKYKEVAAVLNCTESSAKVKAHRALQDLRSIFLQFEKK